MTINVTVVSDRKTYRYNFGADRPYAYSTFEFTDERHDWDPMNHRWMDADELSRQRDGG